MLLSLLCMLSLLCPLALCPMTLCCAPLRCAGTVQGMLTAGDLDLCVTWRCMHVMHAALDPLCTAMQPNHAETHVCDMDGSDTWPQFSPVCAAPCPAGRSSTTAAASR